jgi:conjugal transfer pilin signal peptidase TrbI
MTTDNALQLVPELQQVKNQRRKFAAFLFGLLLIVFGFWSKPVISIGFDPQSERCLPDLHVALLVHKAPHMVHDGDLLFWKPSGALAGFKESYILKEVAGVPGDRVTIRDGKVQINGTTVVKGLPLAHFYHKTAKEFDRDEVIPSGEFFLVGLHPLSNDSRYWGYLDARSVSGYAYKLF